MKLEDLLKKIKCSGVFNDVALAGVGKQQNIASTDCIDDCYYNCDCHDDCSNYDCDCNCDCYSDSD